MDLISLNTKNTICGQYRILLLLNLINISEYIKLFKLKFINYTQLNKVKNKNQFSVSYASVSHASGMSKAT